MLLVLLCCLALYTQESRVHALEMVQTTPAHPTITNFVPDPKSVGYQHKTQTPFNVLAARWDHARLQRPVVHPVHVS